MLGFFIPLGCGQGDIMLQQIARRLDAQSVAMTGVVQRNLEHDPERRCHMDLQILGQPDIIRISQERGKYALGCRLDSGQLALAVHHVEAALQRRRVSLLIINKFGKQESEGEGFRHAIGTALARDIAVLTTVSRAQMPGFRDFAQGMETELTCDVDEVTRWCLDQCHAQPDVAQ
ncbi:MAG: DUF2478 domain-containing protein [Rhodobacteraceae bacterium]|nr:DUF2478 domain-containing protein [Paracoccaceae bacterium]